MIISSAKDPAGSRFDRIRWNGSDIGSGKQGSKAKNRKIASFDVDGCPPLESYNLLQQLGVLHESKKGNTLPFY